MIGLQKEHVNLCLLNENESKKSYEIEHDKIKNLLSPFNVVAIEHVGSTAIPGLPAKPIIDIAVGLNNFDYIEDITLALVNGGYIYLSKRGESTRRIFVKTNGDIRTHHIHVEEYGKSNWINHIFFRNKLLESSKLRDEYAALKIDLAEKYPNDRDRYTLEKADFIQKVLHE